MSLEQLNSTVICSYVIVYNADVQILCFVRLIETENLVIMILIRRLALTCRRSRVI